MDIITFNNITINVTFAGFAIPDNGQRFSSDAGNSGRLRCHLYSLRCSVYLKNGSLRTQQLLDATPSVHPHLPMAAGVITSAKNRNDGVNIHNGRRGH